jgi:hypothetical protein
MRTVFTLMVATVLAASASLALAQSDQDHAAHHPEGASAASGVKKAPVASKPRAAKPKAAAPAASAASGGMGKRMGMSGVDMKQMHDEKHKPGGMHDQMHGKDGQMMGAMPAASAASK